MCHRFDILKLAYVMLDVSEWLLHLFALHYLLRNTDKSPFGSAWGKSNALHLTFQHDSDFRVKCKTQCFAFDSLT